MNGLVPTLEAMFPSIDLGATKFETAAAARQIGKTQTFWRHYIRQMSTPRARPVGRSSGITILDEACNIDESVVITGTSPGKTTCAILGLEVGRRTFRDLNRLNGDSL